MLTELPELESPPDFSEKTAIAKNPYTHHSILLFFTLLWGGNFVLAEVALRELSPISFSVSRFLVAGLVLVGLFYMQGYLRARRENRTFHLFANVQREDWARLILVSILGATLAPWLGIEGLNLTSSGRASLWLALCPVLSAAVGYMMHTEAIRKRGMAGLVIAGIGTVGLAIDGLDSDRLVMMGDFILFLAICCIAVELHIMKPLVTRYGSTSMVASRTVIGGLMYLLVASPSLIRQNWTGLGIWTWIAILVGGAIGVGIGQWVKVRALNIIGPTRVVLYGNLVPPATILIAWIALGTNPTPMEIGAGLLIIAGAACLQLGDPHKRR